MLVLTRFISSSLLKLPYNLLHLLDIPSSTTDCENNVCSINTNVEKKNMTNDHGQTDEAELTSKIAELGKLGWNMEESRKALLATDSDIEKAIASLEETEERQKELSLAIENITDLGWRKEAAESAYLQNNRDITAAIALLESEEVAMQSNFESSVNDMLANGWHELVARQALMTQYAIDERQQAGLNTTMDEAALKDIRPTLKQPKEDPRPKQSQSTAPKSFTRSSSSGSSKTKSEPKVTPAKKEDVVFEVTSDTFQKLVIESPVPVIVDVYADWCGPCKQLGPILEEAAVNSGGKT